MKYHYDLSEWWPVITLSRTGWCDDQAEFSEAEVADFKRVLLEFREWQQKLKMAFGKDIRPYDLMGGDVESIDAE